MSAKKNTTLQYIQTYQFIQKNVMITSFLVINRTIIIVQELLNQSHFYFVHFQGRSYMQHPSIRTSYYLCSYTGTALHQLISQPRKKKSFNLLQIREDIPFCLKEIISDQCSCIPTFFQLIHICKSWNCFQLLH